jgi:RND family efflux transporter MFP subunit
MNMTNINSRSCFSALGVCVLVASGLVLGSCGSSSAKGNEDTAQAAPVVTVTFPLQKGELATQFNAPGELIAYQQVDLYAKVNSFVKKLYVDIGSHVSTGELLATLEAPEITSQIDAAAARVKSQESIFIASRANYERMYETSLTPGTISQNDLDQAAARKNSDSAQLEAARSTLKEAEDTRDYLTLRAPFSGVISARNINTGAYVGPSGKGQDLPMFTLQEQSLLRLVVSVPELYTGYLTDKNVVKFTVKALPGQTFTARVRRLAGAIDNRLRSERIEMDVENNRNQLLPGMVTEVSVPLPSMDSTFVVPRTAVVNSTEKVFVIRNNNGKAEWVNVKTGREAGGHVEIFGDLKEGDQLVLAATEEDRDGSPLKNVKVVSVAAPSGADSATAPPPSK